MPFRGRLDFVVVLLSLTRGAAAGSCSDFKSSGPGHDGGTGGVTGGAGGVSGTGGAAGMPGGTGGGGARGTGGVLGSGGGAGTGGSTGAGGSAGTGGSAGAGGSAGTGGSGCTASAKRCSGNQPQQCDPVAGWQNNGAACTSVCNPCSMAAGACMPATDGTTCTDNNACTQSDKCQSGVCVGMNPVTCPAPTTCHVAGACDMATGVCSNPTAPDNTTACNSGLGVCKSGSCNTPIFTRLGASVYPSAISADGSVVVGSSPAVPAFRWTRATGFLALPGYMGATDCEVLGLSGNGAYAVGDCMGQTVAVRWMGTNAPANLGSGGYSYPSAVAASTDASVMTGSLSTTSATYAGLWRNGAGTTFLGNAVGASDARGLAVSGDGSVIVGFVFLTSGFFQDFRWTQTGGMVLIPFLPGGVSTPQAAVDVSTDGTKVVGTSDSSTGRFAFVYDSISTTVTALAYPGDTTSEGSAISGDGTTVAGFGTDVWLSVNGGTPKLLGTTLAGLGVDLAGFVMTYINDLSANGKVIIGSGFSTGGSGEEGWIAVLP